MVRSRIALRNTLRQPRRSLLLSGAIACGVVVMCLSVGFTAGMEKAIQANVTLFSAGHVLIHGMTASDSGRALNRINDPELLTKIEKMLPDAIGISPTAQAQATVVFGSREQQLRIRGVDWEMDRLFKENLILTQGDWDRATSERAVVMGAQSARRFGLGLGDSVFVRLSTVTGQQNVTEYNLGAVYDDTAAGGMSTVLVSLSNILADLNMKEGQYQSLAIILADASTADSVAKRLSAELPALGFSLRSPQGAAGPGAGGPGAAGPGAGGLGAASSNSAMKSGMGPRGDAQQAILMGRGMASGMTVYRLATVTELSGQMGAVLGSVRWIGATIFAIMLILTMAGITNTYRMVLMERTREIGMLRCIGFKRGDIFKIFVYEALFIAIAGSLAGILASLPMGLFIHAIRFDPSGALGSALSRGHLVFSPDGISFLIISLSVVLASTIAVFGPARRASRLLPAEALRTTA